MTAADLETMDLLTIAQASGHWSDDFTIIDENVVKGMLRHRDDCAHKGTMGHALLVAGKYGMAGAAVLAAKACLRSGVGKVTVHTPRRNNDIMQISVPEAILHHDSDDEVVSQSVATAQYDAMGIGPGLGISEKTAAAVLAQLRDTDVPTVIDADALNVLAANPDWLRQLPKGAILTPHPLEFKRLFGRAEDAYGRLALAREKAQSLCCHILMKDHRSALCLPDGKVVFNTTGNGGMATAGSGDVLTGVITGLLARGYANADAAVVGMYLHGLAGDIAANVVGRESLVAGDLVDFLPRAIRSVGLL